MKSDKSFFRRFWSFLKEDSWPSFFVTLVLAFLLIKFLVFPTLSLLTGTKLPLVIVESCSMHHEEHGFRKVFSSPIYEENGITLKSTKNWIFQDGFNKGDVIFVLDPRNIEIGDVIIFEAGSAHPLIHRVVSKTDYLYSTKGDNPNSNSRQLASEKRISEDQILGKALFRVPIVGWVKLIFFEASKSPYERGFC